MRLDWFAATLLTLALKTLELSLLEESPYDAFFKLNWVVNFEGVDALPGNDIVEAVQFTFVQHHVELPRKSSLPGAGGFRQQVFRPWLFRDNNASHVLFCFVCVKENGPLNSGIVLKSIE